MTKSCETYPTRNGIAIPVSELWLPTSDLNLENVKNFNNHHNSWTAKIFGRCVLFKTLRDLESQQFSLPLDIHEYLHEEYDPPKLPTIQQAMTEIERAKDVGERLQIKHQGSYIFQDLSDVVMSQVIRNYNDLNRKNAIN